MDQRQNNQFLDFSHNIENELQKGSIELLNQIKSCNTLDKKISNIHKSVNLRNGKEYQLIINGILNGMLFDVNMSLDNYFSILYSINQDSFKVFLRTLEKVLDFSKISKDKYDKIYQIFEKLANNNIDNNELTQILILICRNFYPGQDLIYSMFNSNINNKNDINNNHNQNINPNNEGNNSNNYFYKFLLFIKSNLDFIFENDKIFNLPGIIFIKILRLLIETHIYHHVYRLSNNDNLINSITINEITNTYQKIGFNEKEKKAIGEIYDLQIYILTKIYQDKKDKILYIGRELIRHLISIVKANIEIINSIFADLLKDNYYDKILNLPYENKGSNLYAQINIPPLMERMLIFIFTSVKRSSNTYSYYFSWLNKEFHIENCIGNTIIVDIARFIMTNYCFYKRNDINIPIKEEIPRWFILSYLLKNTKNQILSSEIKQVIFMDLILFDKNRDDLYLIEPAISSIMNNMEEFPNISEELIEFLESYVKHFDNNKINLQKRINSVCEGFKIFEEKEREGLNFEQKIKGSKMDNIYKNILLKLIKNENWINQNNKTINNINNNNLKVKFPNFKQNNTINSKDLKININLKNIINNNGKDNNINNIDNSNQMAMNLNNNNFKNQSNGNNQHIIQINTNSENNNIQQISDKSKEINMEINIPKEFNTYVQSNILKNFLDDKTKKNFKCLLNDICNYNIKTYGKSDNDLKSLDSSYKSLCKNFADFYIKVFKDELEFKDFENIDISHNKTDNKNKSNIYSYIFDFAYDKYEDNKIFSFIADLIDKIIKKYDPFILHLMSFVINKIKEKNDGIYNGVIFFYQLNKNNINEIKNKFISFFSKCEEYFLMILIRDFFNCGGVELFNKIFFDDNNLIYKIIKNCDLNSINTINMSLINNNFILIDKKFYELFRFSLLLSPLERNIFWNIIFSQRYIPSVNLKDFLLFCINLLKNPPSKHSTQEMLQINYNEYFDRVIKSILIIFQKEINEDINASNWEKLSCKCMYMFDFGKNLKKYIYQMIDVLLKNYFINFKDREKLFYYMVQQYFNANNKNKDNLRSMVELINYFTDINNNGNIEDKNNEYNCVGWFSKEIKILKEEIMNKINKLSLP